MAYPTAKVRWATFTEESGQKAGAGKAVVATARKLAIIFYKMVANQEAFNPKASEDYQERYKQKKNQSTKEKIKPSRSCLKNKLHKRDNE